MNATAWRNKRFGYQLIWKSNAIWVTEEEYSFKAKYLSSSNDTTQIEIVPNNPWPLLTHVAQGNTDAISKLSNRTSGSSERGMIQLWQCVQILISTLADNYDETTPFKFAKLDIKYDFWRLEFSNTDAWIFCYVLPWSSKIDKIEDIEIVAPKCLQNWMVLVNAILVCGFRNDKWRDWCPPSRVKVP